MLVPFPRLLTFPDPSFPTSGEMPWPLRLCLLVASRLIRVGRQRDLEA